VPGYTDTAAIGKSENLDFDRTLISQSFICIAVTALADGLAINSMKQKNPDNCGKKQFFIQNTPFMIGVQILYLNIELSLASIG